MKTFTPIAMKCTQEQFESIKPKLRGCNFANEEFRNHYILTNNNQGIKNLISFIHEDSGYNENRKVYEEWNEEIFLKACGETRLTLEQQLQKAEAEVKRLKEAIEEENNPKVGDWVYSTSSECLYKKELTRYQPHERKIQNPELIKLLEQEIK